MKEDDFLKEFQKILNPVNQWTGKATTLKEMLHEKLKESGMSQYQAEKLMGMERKTLEGILNNTSKRVDVITLLRLGQFIGLDVATIVNIFVSQISAESIGKYETSLKKTDIANTFDIKNLYKSGFIKSRIDFEHIESRILKYFGFNELSEYKDKYNYIPAFSKGKKAGNILMKEFFVLSAAEHFQKIDNENEYNRDALVELMPKIRPYTQNLKDGLKHVRQALYNVGVTVIYQPSLPTTQIYGATFVIKNKPYIVLTDFYKKYPTLWFSLLHELHHVLYDFDDIEKQVFHLTGEQDLFLLQEDKANQFAREYLFSSERSRYIYPHIFNHFIVEEYAQECQVHSSFIYNFYCYDNKSSSVNHYPRFSGFIPNSDEALNEINHNPFLYESIEDSVQYLKENVYNF